MEVGEVLANLVRQNGEMIETALEGLTEEELYKQPNDQCNSIGWLLWHLARSEDDLVSLMNEAPEIWTEQGINERFGMGAEETGEGDGHEKISAFRAPSTDDLKSYWRASEAKAISYLDSLRPADMDREMPAMVGEGTTNLSTYAEDTVNEALVHGGQIAYVRGMLKGMGWYF